MMGLPMRTLPPRPLLVPLAIGLALGAATHVAAAGSFGGSKSVSRFEMAKIVARLGEILHPDGLSPEAREKLARLKDEYPQQRQELAGRVEALEAGRVELEGALDPTKRGTAPWPGPPEPRTRLSGLVSVAAVVTDVGRPPAAALIPVAPARTRYTTRGDSTFFTLPKVSLGFDHRFQDDLTLHLHFDYASDAVNPLSGGVGLSEAFLLWDHPDQGVQVKLGGFALPFQALEIDGPFRTPTRTITPSVLGTFLESQRALGAEFTVETPRFLGGTDWKLGFFTGSDTAVTATGFQVGTLSDAAGLQALGSSNTFDSSGGSYLEFGSSDLPERRFGARVGWLDNGGDAAAFAPATASVEIQGLILGTAFRRGKFRQVSQFALLDSTSRTGAGGQADHEVGYQVLTWDFDARNSFSFRYDRWQNEVRSTPLTGAKGHAVTYALTRKVSDRSSLQLEYLSPRESGEGTSRLLDFWDQQAQLRYSVWF